MSFHADASADLDARGHWCFFWTGHEPSGRLALIWDKHADILMNETLDRNYRESVAGTWTEFHMCREPVKYSIPSILMEHAFFTNAVDRKLLMSEEFIDKCAAVAVKSACEFFKMEYKDLNKGVDDVSVSVEKIRIASGTAKRIDGNYNIKGSDVRVIKINPSEYEVDYIVQKGRTVEQIAISVGADFAINAPYFSDGNIIGYSRNKSGIISYDYAGSKTNRWHSFAFKNGVPFIGIVSASDVVDFTFKGSPYLVDNGKNISAERIKYEETASEITGAPKPRTAIFLDKNNNMIITIVDGWTKKHQYKYDQGLYLSELANMGIELGALKGTNLDGGGSTTLWVKGQGVINALQDGTSRAVGHALVFKKRQVKLPEQPKNIDYPIIKGTIKVIVNGKEIDETAYLINDRTYLPVRKLVEELGGKIDKVESDKVYISK